MTSSSTLPRTLLIFSILVPLALLVGYLLATPDMLSYFGVGVVVFVTLIPVLLRWHHAVLLVTWNMAVTVFFLPGQPSLWMLIAVISLTISFLDWLLTKNKSFVHVPGVTWSLVSLAAVTLMTAKITGGIGIRALGGGTYGGKQYVLILLAIVGFFALVSQRINPSKRRLIVSLFFLSGITPVVSNLAYFGGPGFYVLYWIFPVSYAFQQALADWSVQGAFTRLGGFSAAGQALIAFLFQLHGFRGLLQFSKPWRWLIFFAVLFFTLMGGFRSNVVIFGVLIVSLFFLERLHRSRLMIAAVALVIVFGAFLITNATRLPLAVQRSLSILPIEVDPIAKYDADATTEWRLRMWSYLLPEVPKHLLKPKGYSLDPNELYLVQEGYKRGINTDIEASIVGGSYHSGPLTLVLGLGIWGVAAFAWFCISALRVLIRNYRYGSPELRSINAFLLAYFLAKLVFYIVVFGHFSEDLFVFTGIVGLALSVNGGVCEVQTATAAQASVEPSPAEMLPQPAS